MISTDDVSSSSASRTACAIAIRRAKGVMPARNAARSPRTAAVDAERRLPARAGTDPRSRHTAPTRPRRRGPSRRALPAPRRRPPPMERTPPMREEGPLPGPLSARKAPRAGATTPPPADRSAVLRAMAGLAAGFGMGPGDPRLRGRARAGRWPRASKAASGRPGGRMAHGREEPPRPPGLAARRMARARAISTARLNASRRLQLRPIDLVVYEGPYRRENSSRRRLPA